jgi:cyclophilin family peptidyl-prolyl cis-trans isomerase/HEAT repeat protein
MKASRHWLVVLQVLAASSACSKGGPRERTATPSALPAQTAAPSDRLKALLLAEHQRRASAVLDEDLTHPDVEVREAAARALARIGDERSLGELTRALSDSAPEVVTWAAFGLGEACRGHELDVVRRLVLRAATLMVGDAAQAQAPLSAVATALGNCASSDAEHTLRLWLAREDTLSGMAASGLARVARERGRLTDASTAALLDAAERGDDGAYFLPLQSLASLSDVAQTRLLEVAGKKLERPNSARALAARALAKAGPRAAPLLGRLLQDAAATASERSDAARALGGLDHPGQLELGKALASWNIEALRGEALLSAEFGVWLALLEALEPDRALNARLAPIAQLPLSADSPPHRRRQVMLRCRAASLLAQESLETCEPDVNGVEGALGRLRALARTKIVGASAARFRALAQSPELRVRQAALELLATHEEIPNTSGILTEALLAPELGARAAAAKVLARFPARALLPAATRDDSASVLYDPKLVQALTQALSTMHGSHYVEPAVWLMQAAAALELLGAKPYLESACNSPNPTLRKHAEKALIALGDRARRCTSVPSTTPLPALPSPRRHRLELVTDLGRLWLELDAEQSPLAAARVLELVRTGFYQNQIVHRVVPGFIVQFGSPAADSFGGANVEPLPCELGPTPFLALHVGIASSGRDTGLSQVFVTLTRAPHLDGEFTWLGAADPGFERLAEGDRLLELRIVE